MNASNREFIRVLLLEQDQRLQEQFKQMQHSMDLMVEHFDQKFDLLVEGQQALAERMDRSVEKYDRDLDRVDERVLRSRRSFPPIKRTPRLIPGLLASKDVEREAIEGACFDT